MSITGQTQGNISEGACEMTGREDTILCQALDHEVYIPHDSQTGHPTGKRVHRELKVTKYFDKTSPLLYKSAATGEHMTEVKLDFYRITPGGSEEHYFTIRLEDAIIVSVKPWVPNALELENEILQYMEDVSFTYRKIYWTWEPDSIPTDDDWLVPQA
jgi:type VI secretion system secreted protein Hcp